jgi:hypothetical protein
MAWVSMASGAVAGLLLSNAPGTGNCAIAPAEFPRPVPGAVGG